MGRITLITYKALAAVPKLYSNTFWAWLECKDSLTGTLARLARSRGFFCLGFGRFAAGGLGVACAFSVLVVVDFESVSCDVSADLIDSAAGVSRSFSCAAVLAAVVAMSTPGVSLLLWTDRVGDYAQPSWPKTIAKKAG